MYQFLWKPKWIVSHVLVLALVVAMILLARWQLNRLDEKRTLNARISARADVAPAQLADILRSKHIVKVSDGDAVEYQAVVVTGTYDTAAEFTVPNRTLDGAPGRFVVTPLDWSSTEAPILVVRGFIPQAVDGNTAPIEGVEPPSGEVQVRGWLRVAELPGTFQSDKVDLGSNRIARMDLDRIAAARRTDLQPVYLQLGGQSPATKSEAIRRFPLPERDEGPHFSYAVQWGVFTIIAIVGYPLVIRRVARGGGKDRRDDVPTDDPDADDPVADRSDPDADDVPVGTGTGV